MAIKAFRLDLPPERVHQLVAEFERLIAATVAHPAIVAPLATGIEGVVAYLAQEYVAAESLDIALRQQGRATATDAVRVATDLAGALDAAAHAHIDHGVLHPRDVLLSADETRLTGLGVARAFERVGVPTPVRRPYTAPERTVGSAWDRRTDIFSLAALVYEMLGGRRLAGVGEEAAMSLADVAGGDTERLRALFARALAEDPDQRFDTASEFAGALQEALTVASVTRTGSRADLRGRLGLQPETLARVPGASAFDAEPLLPLETAVTDDALSLASQSAELPVAEPMLLRDTPIDPIDSIDPVDPPIDLSEPRQELFDSYRHVPEGTVPGDGSRTSVSPLVFALLIGAALGFAAGFGVGTRGRSADSAPSIAAVREFTEGTVAPATASPAAPAPNDRADRNIPPPSGAAALPGVDASAPTVERRVPPRPDPAPSGSLLVRSTPLGARVFVDNREYGRTPVTVSALSRGAHRVRVVRDGYLTDERQVTITAAQRSHAITVRLLPERALAPGAGAAVAGGAARTAGAAAPTGAVTTGKGPLTVESRPAGAKVFIDGQLVGTTPLVLADVPAGDHALHLDRDGYQRWSSTIRIIPTAKNRVAASLDR